MKKTFSTLFAIGGMTVLAATAQAQVLVNLSSLVTETGGSAGGSTISIGLPNPTITNNANALSPGTDFTAGGFVSSSTTTSGSDTPEAQIVVDLTVTGVSFPGTGTVTLTPLFARATLNSTQSNSTVYSLTSGGGQVAAGTLLGNITVGGVNYTISFANNDSIPNPGDINRGSFSLHITAPRGVNQVPEPGTYAMLGTSGIGGLLFLRRRRS